jgi:hypothetical protein
MLVIVLSQLAVNAFGQEVTETWNHKISVTSGPEEFDEETYYAYSTIVFDAKESEVRRNLVARIKEHTDQKVTRKKIISAMQVGIPGLEEEGVSILAKTVEVEEMDDVRVIVAFLNEEEAVNPTDLPEADKIAREIVYKLGVILNQSVVTAQIALAQTNLSTIENKHLSFVNRQTGLEKNLANNELKLVTLGSEADALSQRLSEEKSKTASLKALADGSNPTSQDLGKYDDAVEYLTKIEEQILKNEQAIVDTQNKIDQTREALQEKRNEVKELSEQLIKQNNHVAKLNTKYDAIK